MPDPSSRGGRISRESRLLLLTVGLCALVLLVLARWRFPDRDDVATVAPPLERLAARASYDALAADIQRVEPTIAPNLVVLRVAPEWPAAARELSDVLGRDQVPSSVRHVPALRLGADVALAAIAPGARIDGVVSTAGGSAEAAVTAIDPVRRVARIRVPPSTARQLPVLPLASLVTPAYIVAVEGTQAGATLRPVFLGRGDRFSSPRWSRPLMPLGGIGVAPGALLFTLTGEFIGTVVIHDGGAAIAGARDVIEAVERLGAATPSPVSLGIALQPLTPALAAALGATSGVVVASVDPAGPSASELQAADVITAVDDWSTDDPDELLLRIAARAPGERVTLQSIRDGKPRRATIALAPARTEEKTPSRITFVVERGAGVRVTSAPPDAGLLPGDVITRAGAVDAPSPAQMRQALAQRTPTGYLALVVRRDGRERVVALLLTPSSDAAR